MKPPSVRNSMRFDSVQIPSFGPFTDFRLDLPAGETDIHLIHGPNEAGKSSLLRSLHHFLYGIPSRSTDNFLHPNNQLRIGATLRKGDEALTVFRKKGNKNTLVDADSQVVSESDFTRFTGTVSESFFRHMFGLDTGQLRSGAEQLLSGEGEIGNLLFSANLGGNRIDKAIEKLQLEADSLSKGRSHKNVRIPEAIKRYNECVKTEKDHTVTAKAWRDLEKELAAAQAEYESHATKLKEAHSRARFLDAVLNALPLIRERESLQEALAGISLPSLPPDFPERVRKWQQEHSRATASLAPLQQSLIDTTKGLENLPNNHELLEDAAEIEALHGELNHFRNQQQTLETLTQECEQEESLLNNEAQRQGLESLDTVVNFGTLSDSQLAALEDSREALEASRSELKKSQDDLATTVRELNQKKGELAKLAQSEFSPSLAALLAQAIKHQGREEKAEDLRGELETLERRASALAKQLSISDAETIRDLQPPSREQVTRLVDLYQKRLSERELAQNRHDEVAREIEFLELEVRQLLQGDGEVVTPESLAQARAERDQAWSLLKEKSLSGAALPPEQADSFQLQIEKADHLADRLIKNADDMAQAAQKESELQRKRLHLTQHADSLKNCQDKEAEWQSEWEELTSFQSLLTFQPDELNPWLSKLTEWKENDERLAQARSEVARIEESGHALGKEISAALGKTDTNLATLAIELQELKTTAEQSQGAAKTLTRDLEKLSQQEEDLTERNTEAATANESSRQRWEELISAHGIETTTSPREAIASLRSLAKLKADSEGLDAKKKQITLYREQGASFATRLNQCFTRHLLDREETDPVKQELTLWNLLSECREHQAQRKTLESAKRTIAEKISEIETQSILAESELKKLSEQSKTPNISELDDALRLHSDRARYLSKIEELESQLLRLGSGSSLNDFVAKCLAENPDELEEERTNIEETLQVLQTNRDQSFEALRKHEQRKAQLESASSAAAEARQDAQNALAEIVTDSERFIRLHHAIDFLKAQVEAFKEQSQGPLVSLTSRYFQILTNENYSGVAARQQDDGSVHLVALRPTDSPTLPADEIPTNALSEGTRDQLFLALRLAAIEHHLEKHPAMPLILDDVLMTFDDDRTAALLRAIEPLSRKTQILIFSHHGHLREVATRTLPAMHVHELSGLVSKN
ncbi:ATP-binding protein [Roseibacillus persicicus]|nr:YhaN family protein [Roseibacillus persicicus]